MIAPLGSVTTPVNSPDVVVCAFKLLDRQGTSRRMGMSRNTRLNVMGAHPQFRSYGASGSTSFGRAANTTSFRLPWHPKVTETDSGLEFACVFQRNDIAKKLICLTVRRNASRRMA